MIPAALIWTMLVFQAASPPPGTVHGMVTRIGTTEGLGGVQVEILRGVYQNIPAGVVIPAADSHFAFTDSAGRFEIKNIPPGRYSARIQSNGYSGSLSNNTVVVVTAGSNLELNLAAIPGSIIRGRAIGADGQFLSNVNVTAYVLFYSFGFPGLQARVSKMTDDRGEYRLFGIPPGEYYIGVNPRPPLGQTAPGTGTVRDVLTFYPSTTNAGKATRVTVKGGEEITNIDIPMQSALHVRVSGRVINSLPPPPPVTDLPGVFNAIATTAQNSAQIRMVPRDLTQPGEFAGPGTSVLLSASSGEFEIPNVTPGAYDVFASSSSQRGTIFGRVAIDVLDHDVSGVSLVLRPGVELKGTVLIDGVPQLPPLMNLMPIDSFARLGNAYAVTSGNQQDQLPGAFRMPSVAEGRFRLTVSAADGQYVEDILQNARSIYDAGINVSATPPDPIQVIIKSGGGTVTGSVVDSGNPVVNASVALVPNDRRGNSGFYRSGTSDAAGDFTLRSVPPGEYKLFAWPMPVNGAFYDPAFLQRYEDAGRRVTVMQNSKHSIRIGVIGGQ